MQAEKRYGYTLSRIVLRSFIFVMLTSCLTQVDIDTDKIGGKIVIVGQASTLPHQSYVQLGRTADTERLPFPMLGATVNIIEQETGVAYPLNQSGDKGLYNNNDFIGKSGFTYYVQVVSPEGEKYESVPEKIPVDAGVLSSRYEIITEAYSDREGYFIPAQPFVVIYAQTTVPRSNDNIYLKWSVDEAFLLSPTDFPDPFGSVPPPCYVVQNADAQRVTLYNDERTNVTTFDNQLVAKRIVDWTFLEKHHMTTYQSALTKEAYEYWRKVDVLANQTGSIFDTPPAKIDGNVKSIRVPNEETFGYFQAVNQVASRVTIYPSDFPTPLTFTKCDFFSFEGPYPTRCLECLSVPNSRSERPEDF